MELYNKEFVYFDWDDKLEGKKVMVSDDIYKLKRYVNGEEINTYEVSKSNDDKYPFRVSATAFRFCYYDPYYEFRKAYIEGKQLQYKDRYNGDWIDIDGEPLFTINEYRIKPEPIRWHVVLSDEGTLGIAKSTNKHIYFTGDDEECKEWIDDHKDLTDIMKAWEEGKTIQYLLHSEWRDVANNIPVWGLNDIYRVKPDDCKVEEYVPFDTLDELIHKWEGMNPGCTNRPACAMPMMWVKRERDNTIHLIVNYYPDGIGPRHSDVGTDDEHLTLKELFVDYRFINDSIIGKVKE